MVNPAKGTDDLIAAVTKFLGENDIDATKWHHLTFWVKNDQMSDLFVNGKMDFEPDKISDAPLATGG
jgi:hypothetical protein